MNFAAASNPKSSPRQSPGRPRSRRSLKPGREAPPRARLRAAGAGRAWVPAGPGRGRGRGRRDGDGRREAGERGGARAPAARTRGYLRRPPPPPPRARRPRAARPEAARAAASTSCGAALMPLEGQRRAAPGGGGPRPRGAEMARGGLRAKARRRSRLPGGGRCGRRPAPRPRAPPLPPAPGLRPAPPPGSLPPAGGSWARSNPGGCGPDRTVCELCRNLP